MLESSDFMFSSYFMLENIWHHHFTWSGPNSQENVNVVPTLGPLEPELNWKKFTICCEFGPLQVKLYHIFPTIKMEEYIKPELSGIFWVKIVIKNIVLESLGTHLMHMRVKNSSNSKQPKFWLNFLKNKWIFSQTQNQW